MRNASIISIAVATPEHVLEQADVARRAGRLFSERLGVWDRVAGVFRSSGIRTRRSVCPADWYETPRGWPERTKAYLEGAGDLFRRAAQQALDNARLKAADIDTIVTVSSTGIATPSLEARVAGELGFRANVRRVPVFGLGCAGGVAGLALAARLARAEPGSNVLFVAVEICTLSFRLDALSKANIVATALFGDGAAACIVSTREAGLAQVEAAGDHTWPETLDIMGWNVEPQGFGVIFARAIPPFVEENLSPAIDEICAREGIDRALIDRFVCHPGGAKVIQALETSLRLPQGALDIEREVLSEFGNMSAPTVLFVLERLAQKPLPQRMLMTAMGPGFTASCVSLRAAA
jgi:alkylresorcinol/alkylpyrone synthase